MTMNLRSRLRRIETKQVHGERPSAAILIMPLDDEDRARQIAEHTAAGAYKPGWPLITLRPPRPTGDIGRP